MSAPDDKTARPPLDAGASAPPAGEGAAPDLLQQAFAVFSRASQQLQQSYEELKIRADRLARELAQANEELQRQLAEKERISSFLNNILESIRSGIVVFSPEGDISLTNEPALELLELDGDPRGRHCAEVLGDTRIGRLAMEFIGDRAALPRSVEVELDPADAGRRRIYSLTFAPVLDKNQARAAALLVIQDVTRLKLLEEQALRTNRLAAMGEMAAQLAHEIRNPLGSIEIFASLLSRDLKGDPNQKLADNIVIGVKSLNAVVTNMLTFTRTIAISPERVDFNELVTETLGFLEQVLQVQGIELEMRLADDVGEVDIDPELFKQLILNLAQNAINAMERSSPARLVVQTGQSALEDGRAGVELIIADSGCGISADNLARIFDPFFTTRKGGTGLGLSVVSQIVEKHGGLITAESEVGSGTTMRIQVPATAADGSHV
jgi:signal transduction histidine kinase